MKNSLWLILAIAIVVSFSLGRLASYPPVVPAKTVQTEEPARAKDWFDALPEATSFDQSPAKPDRSEMILRAYYLNVMREQAIRRQQQWYDAELEARRISQRVGDYDPNRWTHDPYRY